MRIDGGIIDVMPVQILCRLLLFFVSNVLVYLVYVYRKVYDAIKCWSFLRVPT